MDKIVKAIMLMALLPVCLYAQENNDSANIDSIAAHWDKVLELNEVVVVGHRTDSSKNPTALSISPRTTLSPGG